MNKLLRRFVLASAVASVPMFAGAAFGQQRLETGRVNDASNRVGSGGYNSTAGRAAASGELLGSE
jgi:hypothetical protein